MQEQVSLKKNAILNIIKQMLKIAFPLITFPYISRVLLEENLGKYNFSLSVISYFSMIAGLGINSYAIREGARIRSDRYKCNQLANELFTINLITTGISYFLLLLSGIIWTKLQSYTVLIAVQSLTILFTTIGVDWINGIYEDYEYMTKRYVFVKLVSLVFIFALVKNTTDYVLYAAIITGSEVLANILNIIYVRKYLVVTLTINPNFKKHILPLLVLFANAIAITIYTNADITMLGIYKRASIVGIYSVSSKVYQIAKSLINAIIVVTVPRLAAILGEGDVSSYNRLLERALKSISAFMIPLITGMFMLSKECVLLLGGRSFLNGNLAVKILSLALVPASINSVFFDGILIVNRKEKYCLIATVVSAVTNVMLNIYFIPKWGLYGASFTTLIAETIGCGLAIWFSRGGHSMRIQFDRDYKSVLVGCLAVVLICLATSPVENTIIRVGIAVLLSVCGYGLVMIIFKNATITNLINNLLSYLRNKE